MSCQSPERKRKMRVCALVCVMLEIVVLGSIVEFPLNVFNGSALKSMILFLSETEVSSCPGNSQMIEVHATNTTAIMARKVTFHLLLTVEKYKQLKYITMSIKYSCQLLFECLCCLQGLLTSVLGDPLTFLPELPSMKNQWILLMI